MHEGLHIYSSAVAVYRRNKKNSFYVFLSLPQKSSSGGTQDDVSTTSRDSNNSSNSNSNTSLPSIAASSTTSTAAATMNYTTSTAAAAGNVRLPMSDKRALFQEKVRQSNEACQNADFQRAIRLYTEALDLDPANHILYSNRSAAHVKLKDFERALTDAIKARELNPKWPKVGIVTISFFFLFFCS